MTLTTPAKANSSRSGRFGSVQGNSLRKARWVQSSSASEEARHSKSSTQQYNDSTSALPESLVGSYHSSSPSTLSRSSTPSTTSPSTTPSSPRLNPLEWQESQDTEGYIQSYYDFYPYGVYMPNNYEETFNAVESPGRKSGSNRNRNKKNNSKKPNESSVMYYTGDLQYHRPTMCFTPQFLRMLGEEVLAFSQWIQPSEAELLIRQDAANRLFTIVWGIWPEAEIKQVGSSETGLALSTSDLDFMLTGLPPNTDPLEELPSALWEYGMVDVKVLDQATVPLIKCVDAATGLSLDISFDVLTAPKSASLVRQYLSEFPSAKPIILLLKTLLRQHNLHLVYTGGLSSYAVTLLVVSYLKLRAKTSPNKSSYILDPTEVGKALVDFLTFFSMGDLQCVFAPSKDTPVERGSYNIKGMKVEDPLDSQNNITRGCYRLGMVQSLVHQTLCALCCYSYDSYSILSSIINPYDPAFASRYCTNDRCLQQSLTNVLRCTTH